MELTLEQTLQKGIEAHKAGRAQEADRYYTAILKANSKHPDANHNMGVLAVSVGKVNESLPFFKMALNVNASRAQYWISYIDALIKLDRLDDAKDVFDKAKAKGAKGDGFDKLAEQLKVKETASSLARKKAFVRQKRIEALISLYNEGKLEEGATVGAILFKEFPNDPNILNILGAIYSALKKNDEAIIQFNKAIRLNPGDAGIYNNLGNTFYAIGKYAEACSHFDRAVKIKPKFSDALNGLGECLSVLEKFLEAVAYFDRANRPDTRVKSIEALFKAKKYSELKQKLHVLCNTDSANIRLAAASAFICNQLGLPDPYPFCPNPLDFFYSTNVAIHDSNSEKFLTDIRNEVEAYPAVWEPVDKTSIGGWQTSDIVFNSGQASKKLETILLKIIHEYRLIHRDENIEFIRNWPTNFSIKGWFVKLLKGGFQESHIHPDGWLSGVVYLKTVKSAYQKDGALELSLHGNHLPIISEDYPKKVYVP